MDADDATPKDQRQSPPDRRAKDDDSERLLRRARQARVAKVLVALALVVIVIIFVIANSQGVEVNFVFVTRHPPLIWIMLGCIVIGGIAGYFVGRPGKEFRRRRKRDRAEPAR